MSPAFDGNDTGKSLGPPIQWQSSHRYCGHPCTMTSSPARPVPAAHLVRSSQSCRRGPAPPVPRQFNDHEINVRSKVAADCIILLIISPNPRNEQQRLSCDTKPGTHGRTAGAWLAGIRGPGRVAQQLIPPQIRQTGICTPLR